MVKEASDRECVDRCLAGDREAFGVLVDRYSRPVYNAVLHMVASRDDAADLCQQAFVKAFEHLGTFDHDRSFFSWMYRLAMNESLNFLKSRRTFEILDERLESRAPSPSDQAEAAERRQQVRRALRELDDNHRAVIVLRHFLNLSYAEAADVLGIPEKTVKSRLFSARQMLREALEGVTA